MKKFFPIDILVRGLVRGNFIDIHPKKCAKFIQNLSGSVATFLTAMRSSEIDGLKWQYVDFDQRQILIREALVQYRQGKGKADSLVACYRYEPARV